VDLSLGAPKDSVKKRHLQQRIELAKGRESDDLPVVVYPEGLTVIGTFAARKRAQIFQSTFLPFDRVQKEAVGFVLAEGVNNRRVRSACNHPVTAQEGIGVASRIKKKVWPTGSTDVDQLVFVVLGGMSRRQRNRDGQRDEQRDCSKASQESEFHKPLLEELRGKDRHVRARNFAATLGR
jgi:hypothetical protein